jgi:Bacterial mobilisation protein (MobC)
MRRLPGGRRRVVFVRLSPDEEAWIVPKAAAEGLSVQRFLVESALPGGRPSLLARRALYREFFAARRDLHGACTNLNQLAHLGNQQRQVPIGVEGCVAELEAAMARLVGLAGLLVPHLKSSFGGAREMGAGR